jgi:hypothetical protein
MQGFLALTPGLLLVNLKADLFPCYTFLFILSFIFEGVHIKRCTAITGTIIEFLNNKFG